MGDFYRKYNNFYWRIIDYLSYKIEKIGQFYEKNIGNQYIKESQFFDISKSKKILHIGCGSYPLTAIILAKKFNKKVSAIDRNPKAVEKAKKIVKKKNLQDKINVFCADGKNYQINGYDTVIISGCTIPFEKIMLNVFKTTEPGSRIISRVSSDEKQKINDMIHCFENISVLNHIVNCSFPFKWDSYMFHKK
jgi:precorrin-6B methylase 2